MMKNNLNNAISYILTGFSALLVGTQENEVFQIIQLILTIISSLLVIAFTAYKFIRRVLEDGKITNEEIDEAFELTIDSLDALEEVLTKKEEQQNDK